MYKAKIIFGPPLAGKTTQTRLIAMKNNYFPIFMGEELRKQLWQDDKFTDDLKYAKLISDDVVIKILKNIIKRYENSKVYNPNNYFLFDDVPRTLIQAKILRDFVEVDEIFYIFVDDERILLKRLYERMNKEKRIDDNKEIFRRRIEEFRKITLPVLKFYDQKIIRIIDGTKNIREVSEEIEKYLKI
jgi:adenylate kinase